MQHDLSKRIVDAPRYWLSLFNLRSESDFSEENGAVVTNITSDNDEDVVVEDIVVSNIIVGKT